MKDFVNQMRDSQFAISPNDNRYVNKGVLVGRYSDNLQVSILNCWARCGHWLYKSLTFFVLYDAYTGKKKIYLLKIS